LRPSEFEKTVQTKISGIVLEKCSIFRHQIKLAETQKLKQSKTEFSAGLQNCKEEEKK
jgi:hypothetical protein